MVIVNSLPIRRPHNLLKPGGHRGRYHNHHLLLMRRVPEGHRPPRRSPGPAHNRREVMTVSLVAATFFGGNIDKTRRFLHEYGYMPTMISKSHLKAAACTPSSLRRGGLSFRCWPSSSRSHPTTQSKHTWWTPCPYRCATTSVSAAAGFIPHKSTEERFVATSPANGDTSTVCGCI
jgi:hypothetical protein